MKLVEILARELKEWPEAALVAMQDNDGQIVTSTGRLVEFSLGQWDSDGKGSKVTRHDYAEKAEDRTTAIVTRSAWEAARAKLSKPKANKDGWIRHRGGKCPVEAGTLVDVRYRDGEIRYKRKALSDTDCASENWIHEKDKESDLAKCDIMAYRIHNPSEQPATTKESLAVDPLQWRDRIIEIDAESKAEAERHNAVMTALDSERAELVQKLASVGLALIERKAGPVEDMSDWRNWKVGDLVVVLDSGGWKNPEGSIISVTGSEGDGVMPIIAGDIWYRPEMLKWHSRPTN